VTPAARFPRSSRTALACVAALLLLLGLLAACSSGRGGARAKSEPDAGTRVLDAVVTEREFDPPGSSGGGSYRGSGAWYLSFEAQEAERTVHYRFPVSRIQYNRYPEGSRVRLVLDGNNLREIRPATDR